MKGSRSAIPLLLTLIVAVGFVVWMKRQDPEAPPTQSTEPSSTVEQTPTPPTETEPLGPQAGPRMPDPEPPLSALASAPKWELLNRWQARVTRDEFLNMMESVFTVSSAWRQWFHLSETDVLIETGIPDERFRLRFADPDLPLPNPRGWRTAEELGPAPEDKPLEGLRIAIDPGHIGGQWAEIEERWFQIGTDTPVQEGDMTLLVAQLLKPRLEDLGATVSLVRNSPEPVTTKRPASLMEAAGDKSSDSPSKLAERLFYRTAEIRSRAFMVNNKIQPDLVLCLHFNADGWGDPNQPSLVNKHHFHLLLNGAYTDTEVGLADQRFKMVRKIVEGTHEEEAALAKSVAAAFVQATKLPPYLYEIDSQRALNIDGNPYLWARNLLANRLYDCPVLFLEPYVMNSKQDYVRIQAGDYEGVRPVGGKPMPSIFHEYATALADGLETYYRDSRPEE